MDPPEHTVYRRLISSAFTPKQLRRIEDQIHRNAVHIVDDLIGAGEIDFVKACSARLPMLTIAEMLGVAEDKRERVAQAGEAIFSSSDDEYATVQERAEFAMRETQLLVDTAIELAQFRRRQPSDDLMTNIVNAEVDGTRLTDEQIGAFMILLTSAGNDTTKQTTTHAMKALVEHPEQRAWLMEDFDSRIGPADRGIRTLGQPGHPVRAVRHPGHRDRRPAHRGWAKRWLCSTARPTGTSRCSTTLIDSTSHDRPIPTSHSAAWGRTTASATNSRRSNCDICSASC